MKKGIYKSAAAFLLFVAVNSSQNIYAQSTEQKNKAKEWVASLNLNNPEKEAKVANYVANHLTAVRDWHNSHPASTVPAGINPITGDKLNDLHRQIIADSAMPDSVHKNLMTGLRAELAEEQVNQILDKYTVGKVEFTVNGYKSIVPDLTAKEEAEIRKNLEKAREMAIDYKSMNEISVIFEIYKNKCEQYLNANGRNWRQLYKDYSNAMKAKKAAEAKNK